MAYVMLDATIRLPSRAECRAAIAEQRALDDDELAALFGLAIFGCARARASRRISCASGRTMSIWA